MSAHHAPIILAAALCWMLPAFAQSDDAALRAALEAAEAGQPVVLTDHPAQGWVEYAALRRTLDTLPAQQAVDFLARHQGQAVAESFRADWLRAAYRRTEWAALRAAWSDAISDPALRCMELDARARTGEIDAHWVQAVQAIWRGSGKSLPDACDAPFAVLSGRGELTTALRWERLDRAASEGEIGMMRTLARRLPSAERALALDYADFIQAPHARALNWPHSARSRRMAGLGLTRLARRNPREAAGQLPRYVTPLTLGETETGPVYYQIALQLAASYDPDAARWLAQVPKSAEDATLREWRVREALARRDWPGVQTAIATMPPDERAQSRWLWFAARAAEHAGNTDSAQALYRQAAALPDFHGFLAADRLNLPYALCPLELAADPALRQRVAGTPAMQRAMALYRIDRPGWAAREWNAALAGFTDAERRMAVGIAQDTGWRDRAVFGMGRVPDDQRHYTLRFPLVYTDLIQHAAQANQLDPAWIAAEIRAESIFNPRARSSANARGLMQVLPTTAQGVAQRRKLPWRGAASLDDPATNITLGSAYLGEKKAMYPAPYIAIAAYNAGPVATRRWQEQRPDADPDVWIETIGYRETRDYVARVLAFSVIYDWRMHGEAIPLSARMRGQEMSGRKGFVCPQAVMP